MGTGKNLSGCYETVIVSLARHVEELMAMKQHWEERAMEYRRKLDALQKQYDALTLGAERVRKPDNLTAILASNELAGRSINAGHISTDSDFFPGFAIPEEVNAPDA